LSQKCFIGGRAAIHQNLVVGGYVILSGNTATALDLRPYVMAAGASTVIGLNLVRLRRQKMDAENIIAQKDRFQEFYHRNGSFQDRAKAMTEYVSGRTSEISDFLNFFLRESKQGIASKHHKIVEYAHAIMKYEDDEIVSRRERYSNMQEFASQFDLSVGK
jgi:acyl-[acyl carrier protein]--UDP-N-acetylglucosamine O-acyltransferase